MSIPDFRLDIERPALITVGYVDRDGKKQVMEADGLLSTAIQHEIDHLNGKLIIDFLSRLKRDMVVKRFKKQARGEASAASAPQGSLTSLVMPLKIVFMGTPDFSVPALEAIVAAGHEVVAVYSQPPRPAGRGMAEKKSPVHVSGRGQGASRFARRSI